MSAVSILDDVENLNTLYRHPYMPIVLSLPYYITEISRKNKFETD